MRALAEFALALATNIPTHLAVGAIVVPLLVGITACIGWRQVLAIGSPDSLVGLLHAARRLSISVLIHFSVPVIAVLFQVRRAEVDCTSATLDQLRASMSISPLAPPDEPMCVRTLRSVPSRSSFSRRIA
jgi:hypothetical protein